MTTGEHGYVSRGGATLLGGAGGDRLEGGLGRDTLNGGNGLDVFVFKDGDSPPTSADCDTLQDFVTGVDKIDLHTIGGSGLALVVYAETTAAAGSFGAASSAATAAMADGTHSVVFVAGPTDGGLFWNTDANLQTFEQTLRLTGLDNLDDFQHGDLM